MLAKTEGIVIKNTRYSESSVISKIYTRNFGMQTYMINGVRSPKAAIKPSLLQIMMPLEMVVYHNNLKDIQRIREAKSLFTVQSLHFDMIKSTIAMFMAELVYKAVREEEPNPNMFDFIMSFLKRLDETEENLSLYPLYFSLQLSNYLGFFPQDNYSESRNIFLLREGYFSDVPALGGEAIGPPDSEYLARLLSTRPDELSALQVPRASRQLLLQTLMDYYIIHLPNFQPLKSVGILANVLRED